MLTNPIGGFKMDTTPKALGKRIRQAREARGFSRPELARYVGCHPDTIANAERGEHLGQWSTIQAIMRLLGLQKGDET